MPRSRCVPAPHHCLSPLSRPGVSAMDDAATASHETESQQTDASEKQFAANRANAAHSTGPRTEEGKARSRLNALKHGLLATEAANFGVEGEPARRAFEGLSDRLEDYYRPHGPIEEILVQKIAIATWRLKRAMRFEARAIHQASLSEEESHRSWSSRHKGRRHPSRNKMRDWGIDGAPIPVDFQLMLLIRYESAINRDLYRAMNEIRKVRKERESFDQTNDEKLEASTDESGASDEQNYQTNPNPPSVNTEDGLEGRIEGESPPDIAPAG